MLTIIIGIIIAVVAAWINSIMGRTRNELVINIGAACGCICIVSGLFFNIQGYKSPVLVKEIDLIPLNETVNSGGTKNTFCAINSDGSFSYKYKDDDEHDLKGTSYKIEKVYKDVSVVKSKECKKPVLKVYERKVKKGIWTFAIFVAPKTEYVFYIPE